MAFSAPAARAKKKNLLIIHEEVLFFCVRSTPLRRLGGGFRGTYIPVPGTLQVHSTKRGSCKATENSLEPFFVLKFTNPYTPKGFHFLVFT